VVVAVDRDLVTCRRDLGREGRPAVDLLADQKEGRLRPRFRQPVEHGGGSFGMRAVVECQGDAGLMR
jgi:hypothetical protein